MGQKSEQILYNQNTTATSYPVTILYGGDDIYGSGTQVVYARFSEAQKILLENSGHIPWLQGKDRFIEVLRQFYHS